MKGEVVECGKLDLKREFHKCPGKKKERERGKKEGPSLGEVTG